MTHMRAGSFIGGLVCGSVVGAAIALLVAPYSGEATRNMVRERGQALRDRAVQTAEEARATAEAVQARSQAALTESVDRLARTAEAAKRAAQTTWEQGATADTPAGANGAQDY